MQRSVTSLLLWVILAHPLAKVSDDAGAFILPSLVSASQRRRQLLPAAGANRSKQSLTLGVRSMNRALGVFHRPEDIGVALECHNSFFLARRSNGGCRLVTAFTEVGGYSKPQPSIKPDVNSTLRSIACWKYIVVSDLTSAFYQIPLAEDSLKYCGVITPFRGVRAYTRCAMGMPGSETALEELMCRVLGDILQEGVVAKLADDLYCGCDSLQELLDNWSRVLDALELCNIRLSAKKIRDAPKQRQS